MTRIERFALGIAAVLAVTSVATFAQASTAQPAITWVTLQGPSDPPPGDMPPGDMPPGGRPPRNGRPGGPGQPPPLSAATLPVEIMTSYLKLTSTQSSKIQEINIALREEMRPPHPPGISGGGNGEQRPQPPSQEEHEARKKTVDAAIQRASSSVIALLDEEQKPRLTVLLKAFEALRAGRIPPPALRNLKLTDAQWTQLANLGASATHEKIVALLTEAQKSALQSSRPGFNDLGHPPHDGPPPPPDGEGPGGPPPGGF